MEKADSFYQHEAILSLQLCFSQLKSIHNQLIEEYEQIDNFNLDALVSCWNEENDLLKIYNTFYNDLKTV